jgi:hypothetical protein
MHHFTSVLAVILVQELTASSTHGGHGRLYAMYFVIPLLPSSYVTAFLSRHQKAVLSHKDS